MFDKIMKEYITNVCSSINKGKFIVLNPNTVTYSICGRDIKIDFDTAEIYLENMPEFLIDALIKETNLTKDELTSSFKAEYKNGKISVLSTYKDYDKHSDIFIYALGVGIDSLKSSLSFKNKL